MQKGVWDMLISRIGVSGKIDVLGRHAITESLGAKTEMTQDEAIAFGKKMKVDYVVWGSITKIGNSVSLDGKLLETASSKSPVSVFAQSQGLDDVITKVNDFAKRVDTHILGQAPSTFDQPAAVGSPVPRCRIAAAQDCRSAAGGNCVKVRKGARCPGSPQKREGHIHVHHQPGFHSIGRGGPPGVLDEPQVRRRMEGDGRRGC